ncbi:MAG TPA: DNA polymerase III subunit delta [Gemmatimonadales bacterium]|nr:DNA polymerase III subunit delta [Gemmatimonadales bacterium]
MPTLSLDALRKQIKAAKLAPVYYFHGPEETLKEEALAALLDVAVEPSARDFNLDVRTAPALDPEAVHALVNTLPMMAERRAVVLRDVDGWTKRSPARKALLDYLERPAAETLLVLHQGAPKPDDKDEVDTDLAAKATTVNFPELDTDEALAWVTRRAKALKVPLTPEGAAHLVDAVGSQLALLKLELEKLAALGSATPLGPEQVGEYVGVRHGETVYDLRDAIFRRDVAKATAALPRVLTQSGVSGVSLVSLLGTSFLMLGVVRAAYDRKLRGGALGSAVMDGLRKHRPGRIGVWGAFVDVSTATVAEWPQGRIRRALAALLEADQALKGGRQAGDEAVLLDLILQVGARMPAEVVA